eukprot:g5091.t1
MYENVAGEVSYQQQLDCSKDAWETMYGGTTAKVNTKGQSGVLSGNIAPEDADMLKNEATFDCMYDPDCARPATTEGIDACPDLPTIAAPTVGSGSLAARSDAWKISSDPLYKSLGIVPAQLVRSKKTGRSYTYRKRTKGAGREIRPESLEKWLGMNWNDLVNPWCSVLGRADSCAQTYNDLAAWVCGQMQAMQIANGDIQYRFRGTPVCRTMWMRIYGVGRRTMARAKKLLRTRKILTRSWATFRRIGSGRASICWWGSDVTPASLLAKAWCGECGDNILSNDLNEEHSRGFKSEAQALDWRARSYLHHKVHRRCREGSLRRAHEAAVCKDRVTTWTIDMTKNFYFSSCSRANPKFKVKKVCVLHAGGATSFTHEKEFILVHFPDVQHGNNSNLTYLYHLLRLGWRLRKHRRDVGAVLRASDCQSPHWKYHSRPLAYQYKTEEPTTHGLPAVRVKTMGDGQKHWHGEEDNPEGNPLVPYIGPPDAAKPAKLPKDLWALPPDRQAAVDASLYLTEEERKSLPRTFFRNDRPPPKHPSWTGVRRLTDAERKAYDFENPAAPRPPHELVDEMLPQGVAALTKNTTVPALKAWLARHGQDFKFRKAQLMSKPQVALEVAVLVVLLLSARPKSSDRRRIQHVGRDSGTESGTDTDDAINVRLPNALMSDDDQEWQPDD